MSEEKRDPMKMSRRSFVKLGAAGLATIPFLSLTACNNDPNAVDYSQEKSNVPLSKNPADVKESTENFDLGVQAGAMTQDSAVLWTKTNDKKQKKLRVWRENKEQSTLIEVFSGDVKPDKDGFIQHSVAGLAAGATYSYAFFDGETQRSPTGSFSTAWPDTFNKPLQIAVTACTNRKKYDRFAALEYMAEQETDLFIHLGDMTYNDGALSHEDYLSYWKKTFDVPGMKEVLSSTGMYMVWDDHEFVDNNSLYEEKQKDRVNIARDVLYQMIPHTKGKKGKYWNSYRWGSVAEFYLLDCRLERDYSTYDSDKPQYITTEQMEWLKSSLESSPCTFKVILNSVPITNFPKLWNLIRGDRWEGWAKQRQELLDFIKEKQIKNTWFLSGDLHFGGVIRIEPEGEWKDFYEITCGPGGNHLFLWEAYKSYDEATKELFAPKDQFQFFYGLPNATLITLDPADESLSVKFVSTARKKDPDDPDKKLEEYEQRVVYERKIVQQIAGQAPKTT